MNRSFEFWDALAPHHSAIENSYLDLPSLRQIFNRIQPRVLVVPIKQFDTCGSCYVVQI